MGQDFFDRQNSLLSLIYVLSTAVIAALIPINRLLILAIIQILYFFINYKILLNWMKILLKLLPFFISLLVISLIFNTPFDHQLYLTLRIAFILLLSVYLLTTSSIESFLADTGKWNKSNSLNDLRLFLVSTMFFIPIFVNIFQEKKSKIRKRFSLLPEILQESFSQIKSVEKKAVNSMNLPGRKFDLTSNLIPIILISINFFLLLYFGNHE